MALRGMEAWLSSPGLCKAASGGGGRRRPLGGPRTVPGRSAGVHLARELLLLLAELGGWQADGLLARSPPKRKRTGAKRRLARTPQGATMGR